jgi:hypothetical protein
MPCFGGQTQGVSTQDPASDSPSRFKTVLRCERLFARVRAQAVFAIEPASRARQTRRS